MVVPSNYFTSGFPLNPTMRFLYQAVKETRILAPYTSLSCYLNLLPQMPTKYTH
jgi:hypothetical protein